MSVGGREGSLKPLEKRSVCPWAFTGVRGRSLENGSPAIGALFGSPAVLCVVFSGCCGGLGNSIRVGGDGLAVMLGLAGAGAMKVESPMKVSKPGTLLPGMPTATKREAINEPRGLQVRC